MVKNTILRNLKSTNFKPPFSSACRIQFDDYVVITAGRGFGWPGMKTVSVYNEDGWVEDLPDLNYARWYHACGYYYDSDDQLVS